MKIKKSKLAELAFTLIELLVVITIIGILVSVAVPVFSGVLLKANQTKALSNAKQITLSLRLYANDNNDIFPDYQIQAGVPTTTSLAASNDAFAQLFPNYINEEAIFWVSKSAWCSPTPPNEQQDAPPISTPPTYTLGTGLGENEWAYVEGLNDTSTATFPLIASGLSGGTGMGANHYYVADAGSKGGVWKGATEILFHPDGSGQVVKTTATAPNTYYLYEPIGNSGVQGDVFDVTKSANGWLAPTNYVLNPD